MPGGWFGPFCYFPTYRSYSSQLIFIFFRGVETTNQIQYHTTQVSIAISKCSACMKGVFQQVPSSSNVPRLGVPVSQPAAIYSAFRLWNIMLGMDQHIRKRPNKTTFQERNIHSQITNYLLGGAHNIFGWRYCPRSCCLRTL